MNQSKWLLKPLQNLLTVIKARGAGGWKVRSLLRRSWAGAAWARACLIELKASVKQVSVLAYMLWSQSISHALEPQEHSPGTDTFLGHGQILPGSQEGVCWGFHSGLGGSFAFARGLVLFFLRVHHGKHTAQELRLLAALRWCLISVIS